MDLISDVLCLSVFFFFLIPRTSYFKSTGYTTKERGEREGGGREERKKEGKPIRKITPVFFHCVCIMCVHVLCACKYCMCVLCIVCIMCVYVMYVCILGTCLLCTYVYVCVHDMYLLEIHVYLCVYTFMYI